MASVRDDAPNPQKRQKMACEELSKFGIDFLWEVYGHAIFCLFFFFCVCVCHAHVCFIMRESRHLHAIVREEDKYHSLLSTMYVPVSLSLWFWSSLALYNTWLAQQLPRILLSLLPIAS